MSKGYTIQFFINTLKNSTAAQVKTRGVYNVISPRNGYNSVKARALDAWLYNDTTVIANGEYGTDQFGRTARARLLTALKLRQRRAL